MVATRSLFAVVLIAGAAAFAAPPGDNPTSTTDTVDALRLKGYSVAATYPVFSQIVRFSYPAGFVPVTEATQGPSYLQESVPKGESAEQWTQMITVSGARGAALNPSLTPGLVTGFFVRRYQEACPQTYSSADLGSGGPEAFEGHVTVLSCGTVHSENGDHSEAMLIIVLKGREEYYTIQWATRGPAVAIPREMARAEWLERLRLLQPIKVCDKVPGEGPPFPSCAAK